MKWKLYLKTNIVFFLLFTGVNVTAQLKIKVNGNLVDDNTTIKCEEIRKFEIAFDNPKVLKDYGQGKVVMLVSLTRTKGETIEEYYFVKNGMNAIEAFLGDVNVYYTLYEQGIKQRTFKIQNDWWDEANTLVKTIKTEAERHPKGKRVTIKTSLYFKDRIGYEKYGDAVDLLKPIIVNIDNAANINTSANETKADEKQTSSQPEQNDSQLPAKAEEKSPAKN